MASFVYLGFPGLAEFLDVDEVRRLFTLPDGTYDLRGEAACLREANEAMGEEPFDDGDRPSAEQRRRCAGAFLALAYARAGLDVPLRHGALMRAALGLPRPP